MKDTLSQLWDLVAKDVLKQKIATLDEKDNLTLPEFIERINLKNQFNR